MEVIRCRVALLLELEWVLSKVGTFPGVGDLLYIMLLAGNPPPLRRPLLEGECRPAAG